MSDRAAPRIVVHALADALAALRAARDNDTAVTLVSAPGAAGYAGAAWFREVVAQARAAVADARCDAVLDCAGNAGHALAAIREGVEAIGLDAPDTVVDRVADIARQAGCTVISIDYSQALDLANCPDPERACRDWLARRRGAPS